MITQNSPHLDESLGKAYTAAAFREDAAEDLRIFLRKLKQAGAMSFGSLYFLLPFLFWLMVGAVGAAAATYIVELIRKVFGI